MDASDRLLGIVVALQEEGWQRAADLAARLGVSARTIYRDVEALAEAGVPVVGVPGRGYRLSEHYFLPALRLTTDEAVLLRLATDDVDRRLGTRHRAAAAAVRAKLDALLPDRLRTEAAALQQRLRLDPVNPFDDPAQRVRLDRAREAVAARRALRYRDPAGTPHVLHPYGLVHLGGAWHVLGLDPEAGRVRHLRTDRMEAPEVLADTFERPAAYAAAPADDAPREVEVDVLFDAEAAPWVRRAPSAFVAAMEATPDGGLRVALHAERVTQVLPWLLSWGAHARVLGPPSLRQRLAREAAAVAAQYQPAPSLLDGSP